MPIRGLPHLKEIRDVFSFPHRKVRSGRLWLDDETESAAAKIPSTIRIHRLSKIDLTGSIRIGAWTYIMPGVELLTHFHSYLNTEVPLLVQVRNDAGVQPVNKWIGKDVWIHRAAVLAKCTFIADGVMIGMQSVVTKPIELPYSIWAGNPARLVGFRDPDIRKKIVPKFLPRSRVVRLSSAEVGTVVTADFWTSTNSWAFFVNFETGFELWVQEADLAAIGNFNIPIGCTWRKKVLGTSKPPEDWGNF